MSHKRWEDKDNDHTLYFEPYYDEEEVAYIFQDKDGDWWFTSKLLQEDGAYLCDSEVCLQDAKLQIEEYILNYYESEIEASKELMDRFSK